MCWALYLASDKELPQIPWDENARGFNTQSLRDDDKDVSRQFSHPYIIYLGSHEGCGCGFKDDAEDDEVETALRNNTLQQLAQYLNQALSKGAKLEIFLCWEGDQETAVVERKELTPANFWGAKFPLSEREFATVEVPPT